MTTATLPSRHASRVAAGAVADTRPWASYGRISKRKAGDGRGAYVKIADQHADNRARLADHFGDVQVVTFSDNLSAWDPNVTRPDYEQMMAGLRDGKWAGVIAWHGDRFTRQPMQQETLWDTAERQDSQVWTALQGHIEDPTLMRIEGAIAWKESKQKSNRLKRHHQRLREAGMFHGGRRRFGYEPGMVAVRESEARWVRWAATGVLGGRSIKSLAEELTARGVTTSSGLEWRPSNLGKFLRQPMLAGLATHQGDIIGDATWDAVLDLATWEACRTLLEKPERRTSHTQARRYLLSGVARCGVCGGVMRARNNGTSASAAPAYFCPASGCVHRRADLVEAHVRRQVVLRLSQVDAAGLLSAPQAPDGREALAAQVSALNANLDALAVQAALGKISQRQMLAGTEAVQQELADLESQMADLALVETQPAAVLEGLTGLPEDQAAAAYDALDLDRRRAVVDLLATVTLCKAPRKGAPWDPALVQVDWKG